MVTSFFELPQDNLGRFLLLPPKGCDDDFKVFIKNISINQKDYFLVEAIGIDMVIGLLCFFLMFTGRHKNGDSDESIPFLVKFDNGVTYLLFRYLLFLEKIKISYIPVVLLHQSKKLDIWYWL